VKYIFAIILSLTFVNAANASRCGLAVKFFNPDAVEKNIVASIDWHGMEIDSGENDFPGDVAHRIEIGAAQEVTELFVFPCGYPGDPKEFWVNYRVSESKVIERKKYKKGVQVRVTTGT